MTKKIALRINYLMILTGLFSLVGCSSTPSSNENKLSKTERAYVFVQMANNHLYEKKPSEALAMLIEAEKENPTLPEIYHSRALAYFQMKELKKAIAAARKSIEVKKNFFDGYTTLGKLLFDSGNFVEAEKVLKISAEDESYVENYKPKTTLGILYYRKGDLAQAKNYFQKAINASPSMACIAYYYQGHLSLKSSQLKDAIKMYDKARNGLCASFSDAHFALGVAYLRDKQSDRARRVFLDVQDRFPNTSAAHGAVEQLKNLQ